jgi:mono/diheme cytochrome c family protein
MAPHIRRCVAEMRVMRGHKNGATIPRMRRVSPVVRIARAMLALVTVWCLGCSGYEPLLGQLIGSSGMACASRESMTVMAGVSTSASDQTAPPRTTVSAVDEARAGFDCGCGSCHAPSPAVFAASPPHRAPPSITRVAAIQPPAPDRAILLPPPERSVC